MDQQLCTCGCCDGVHPVTPVPENNLPGLPAIAYRAGTQARFFETMIAKLADALPALTTRRTDDPSIALIDAWAMTLDVLTFYQERIANEGFLRTAVDRRSLLELARAIGYELRPGVAAGAVLAFTLETIQGAPPQAAIPTGTKAQSIPGQGETAQTFETVEDITGKPVWNALLPATAIPQKLKIGNGLLLHYEGLNTEAEKLFFTGTATNLKPGDVLLITTGSGTALHKVFRDVLNVTVDAKANQTIVDIGVVNDGDAYPLPELAEINIPNTSPASPASPLVMNATTVRNWILKHSWTEKNLQAFLETNQWNADDVLNTVAQIEAANASIDNQHIYVFRDHSGIFGNNAPVFESLLKSNGKTLYGKNWDSPAWKIWNAYPSATPFGNGVDIYLDRPVSGIVKNSWVMLQEPGGPKELFLVNSTIDASLSAFGMSAKATGVGLLTHDGKTLPQPQHGYTVRSTTAFFKTEELAPALLPVGDVIAAGTSSLTLSGMTLGLRLNQLIMFYAERNDSAGVFETEILVVDEIVHAHGYTTIVFHTVSSLGLQYSYKRSTVTMNANVARATHGETKTETLGAGDASQAWQKFVLKQSPLTFVSAPTPGGTQSTLQIRANDLLWSEEPEFFTAQPADKIFTTRLTDDGKTIVNFGDGIHGRRLPTGAENITAQYRVGIGTGGNVDAGKISMLMSRPLGVKSVINPVAASGGADPQSRDDARANAPLTVTTLDRIVSLQDFEDFTASFAGIGKALAEWMWDGEHQLIHLTVAGADGAAVDPSSALYTNLKSGIENARDPGARVQIDSYEPLSFCVNAKVLVNAVYEKEIVIPAVAAALADAFSFAQRGFGRGVARSEVEAVMQRVDGVDAIDLDSFYITSIGNTGANVLPAQTSRWSADAKTILPAQLLLVNPNEIKLTEMQP